MFWFRSSRRQGRSHPRPDRLGSFRNPEASPRECIQANPTRGTRAWRYVNAGCTRGQAEMCFNHAAEAISAAVSKRVKSQA